MRMRSVVHLSAEGQVRRRGWCAVGVKLCNKLFTHTQKRKETMCRRSGVTGGFSRCYSPKQQLLGQLFVDDRLITVCEHLKSGTGEVGSGRRTFSGF